MLFISPLSAVQVYSTVITPLPLQVSLGKNQGPLTGPFVIMSMSETE